MARQELATAGIEKVGVTRADEISSFELELSMRKFEKQKLDEIGKAVVKAGSISAHNIDLIVAKPDLFDGVRKRIPSNAGAISRSKLFMRPGFAAVGVLIFVAVASFAFFTYRSKPVEVTRLTVKETPKANDTKRFTEPDRVAEIEKPVASDIATPSRPERISVTARQPEKMMRPKTVTTRQADHHGDFYALSYAGDPNETERGGRIVRVDISRSTLFAMGFDLPLENESDTVRADLLIGNDGVTRAVRVVK
jgi:hypothetical protein